MLTKVWSKYPEDRRREYENYIKMYGSLSALFNQKSDTNGIPYLDSKFQETIYAKSFNDPSIGLKSKDVDYGNTPHDILSVFPDGTRIGIGIKTWLYSHQSYQKVAQIKSYNSEVTKYLNKYLKESNSADKQDRAIDLIQFISKIKDKSLEKDYKRLGLNPETNIYNYVTRDKGRLNIQETSYPEINYNKINDIQFHYGRKNKAGQRGISSVSFYDSEHKKEYRFGFADSQFFMRFNASPKDHKTVKIVPVSIMKNPFKFLANAFKQGSILIPSKQSNVVYLPLYSPSKSGKKNIRPKSGLNASLGAPKTKGSGKRRPKYEAYIPIPKEFRDLNRHWFSPKVDLTNRPAFKQKYGEKSFKFRLHLPDGTIYPALIGQDEFKGFESNPQSKLGKWILNHILNKGPYERVTMKDLKKYGCDSLKLWHADPNDLNNVWIDFAPWGAYERFISQEEAKQNK